MTTRTSQTPGGANGRRVILLEFNELCPPLLDRWMGEGKLPNFKVLHDRSKVFETLADEPEGPNLEPWIQWHSIHTGQPFSDHKVFHLTEGKRYKGTDWYEHFRENGLSVASFGSMNVRPFAEEGSLFLADPWSEDDDAYPADLNLFNAYVARQIREYTNEKNQPGWRDHLRFGLFLLGHGLSISTITATIRQLLQEWGDRRYGFQRVAILDRIYMDVFSHYYRKLHPNFATIFLNSTAHLQHAYWRHLEPEKFHIPPTDPEFYRDAILFGYQSMDRLLGRFMHLAAKEGAQLAFATALSQQPFLKYEATGGQNFYRLRNAEGFMAALGLNFRSVEPVMTHQYLCRGKTTSDEVQAKKMLGALFHENKRAFLVEDAQDGGLYCGCLVNEPVKEDTELLGLPEGISPHFFDHFYRIDALKSGRHHPKGCFWIESNQPGRVDTPLSILDIYPHLAALFGLEAGASSHTMPASSPSRKPLKEATIVN